MPVWGAAAWAALPFAKSFAPPSVGVTSTAMPKCPAASASFSRSAAVQTTWHSAFEGTALGTVPAVKLFIRVESLAPLTWKFRPPFSQWQMP